MQHIDKNCHDLLGVLSNLSLIILGLLDSLELNRVGSDLTQDQPRLPGRPQPPQDRHQPHDGHDLGRKAHLDLSFLFQKHGEINQYLCDYSESCFCEVCEMAKCNVKEKLSLIRKGKVDRPRKNDPESPAKVIKRCSKCEAVVGAGLKHNCKSVKNFKIWELFCHPTWSFKLLVKWSKTTYSMAKVMS